MDETRFAAIHQGNPPANYERFFVPAIGAPLAEDLVRHAALREGERVLDVACGTGVVARLAAQKVGPMGTVAGLDLNPGMLAVARSATPQDMRIEWHEASAESMPFPDASFDVVLCQLGLQFMGDRAAALREMRRVLVPGGRLLLNLPGPTPRIFSVMADALARHVGPEAAGFVNAVFSLYEPSEIEDLVNRAGFQEVAIQSDSKPLRLPESEEFLWQYVQSTPLVGAVAQADEESLDLLERDVIAGWREFETDRALDLNVRVAVATAHN